MPARPPRHPVLLLLAASLICCAGCSLLAPSDVRLVRTARAARRPAARRAALERLQGRVATWMRGDLEALLREEPDAAAAALAAELLGYLRDPRSEPALADAAHRDAAWLVRRSALHALSLLPGVDIEAHARQCLREDTEPMVRAETIMCMMATVDVPGEPEALRKTGARYNAFLLDALDDEAPLVRLRAATMLTNVTGLHADADRRSWEAALRAKGLLPPPSPEEAEP